MQGLKTSQGPFSNHAAQPMERSIGCTARQASVASTFADDVEGYDGKEVGASSEQPGDH